MLTAAALALLAVAFAGADRTAVRAAQRPPTMTQEPPRDPVAPEDPCTLGDVQPILKDSDGQPVTRLRNGPRDLVERIRIRDSLLVEIAQGGCAHYGVRFAFTPPPEARPEQSRSERTLLEDAHRYLRLLEPHTTSHVVADVLAILAARLDRPPARDEPLQDRGFPDVTVTVAEPGDGTGNLEVTYSFVL